MARLAPLATKSVLSRRVEGLPPRLLQTGVCFLYYFATSTTTLRRPITYRRTRVWVEENSREKKNPTVSDGAVSVPNLSGGIWSVKARSTDHRTAAVKA